MAKICGGISILGSFGKSCTVLKKLDTFKTELRRKVIKKVIDNILDNEDTSVLDLDVIDNYMKLIAKRSPNTVHVFDCYFYSRLLAQGYDSSLAKWTKNVDIFSKKMLFIPIVNSYQWSLIYVNIEDKFIKYYDSLESNPLNFFSAKLILKYLMKEHIDKKKTNLHKSGWLLINAIKHSEQFNFWGRGEFLCMFAERIARNVSLDCSKEEMTGYRNQIYNEIKNNELQHALL